MKLQFKQIVIVLFTSFLFSCSAENSIDPNPITTPIVVTPPTTIPTPNNPIAKTINYLALGDSYTIGQNVCETCRFPEQLKSKLATLYPKSSFTLKIIATTGWTTSNLISAIKSQNPESKYDLVTLLIGVNNQYQGVPFSVYQKEFPELISKAITLAKGNKKNVVVLSIPDYAYTSYGNNMSLNQSEKITKEINEYNSFAENYCKSNGIVFVGITDITRQGLINPNLVASDGLHPSESAYMLFVERMLPNVKVALQD
ncbi:SGNH/GDSL hydrolase family protein [Flavobacterium sp.]|uniref:SGNH/GDSL hydrolase family protein n=1 Tax=Flavobacterium sp. TaxID=239 RepID=UPI003267B5AF